MEVAGDMHLAAEHSKFVGVAVEQIYCIPQIIVIIFWYDFYVNRLEIDRRPYHSLSLNYTLPWE